jgi:hypothetical protein
MTAQQAYEAGVSAAQARLGWLDRRGATLANLRTLAFLAMLALLGLVIFERLPREGLMGALACFALYVALAVVHARVIREEEHRRVQLALNQRGLQRLAGQWRSFPETGAALLPEGHLYAGDLDLLGPASLFQRLDETGTRAGERQLAQWLLEPAGSAEAVKARQLALQELAPKLAFRQALVTETRIAGQDKADPSRFIDWCEASSALDAIRWAWPVAHLLPALTLVLGLLSMAHVLTNVPVALGVLAQVVVVLLTRKPLGRLWEALLMGDRGFVRFSETFAAIDAEPFVAPRLRALQAGLGAPGTAKVSTRLSAFTRLLGFAELKHSGQMHPLINALTLWDVHVLFRLDRWRQADGRDVRRWFEALSELEALSSLATLPFEHPELCWPTVTDGEATFEAEGLFHPLLEHPVANDVAMKGPGLAWIITGSNMSGKTTLMRTVGLNTVMALAGLPVCARAATLSRLQVVTSMRVKDSLERGVSYFYAEVRRVKALIDAVQANPKHCLFLLDEIFMGTNTRERQVASRYLLSLLVDLGAVGAVTTHDVSLCELEQTRPGRVVNVHFRDHIEAGQMRFDYRLYPGVVTTSNALEVLRRAGVPVPDEVA